MTQSYQIYVGIPKQQDRVLQKLVSESKHEKGIFVVAGGCRVGKNTVVENALTRLHVPRDSSCVRPDINILDDDPSVYLGTVYRGTATKWLSGFRHGQRVFAIGEVFIEHQKTLKWIHDFYEKANSHGKHLKIFLNVVSKDYPVWQNVQLNHSLHQRLRRIFPHDLHYHYLFSSRQRIIDELWRERNTDHPNMAAIQLGFKGFNWRVNVEGVRDYDLFSTKLNAMMNEGNHRHPERR